MKTKSTLEKFKELSIVEKFKEFLKGKISLYEDEFEKFMGKNLKLNFAYEIGWAAKIVGLNYDFIEAKQILIALEELFSKNPKIEKEKILKWYLLFRKVKIMDALVNGFFDNKSTSTFSNAVKEEGKESIQRCYKHIQNFLYDLKEVDISELYKLGFERIYSEDH